MRYNRSAAKAAVKKAHRGRWKRSETELNIRLMQGSCKVRLKELATASVDSIVTDPPYELKFMGSAWDATGIAYDVEMWRECLRVLKPGGHLLAFGGSRTYHRMACAIEDAGFEIRDSLHWIYGGGLPKGVNVSKSIEATNLVGGSSPKKIQTCPWKLGSYRSRSTRMGWMGNGIEA